MADTPQSPCLDLEQLESLAADSVQDVDGDLARHLDECPACRARLLEIREHSSLFDDIRGAGLSAADLRGQDRARGEEIRPDGESGDAPIVPGYERLEPLHRGGQGVVYRATQHATRREVALKVLAAGRFATSRQRIRFERELDLVASLRDPGIVTVHDGGTTAEGRQWIAMELVDGIPFDEFVAANAAQLGTAGLLRLFAQACDAVAAAHRRGVIHRDLKPANILVDTDGRPRVLDFGLARSIDPTTSAETIRLTVEHGFMGTLAYAAPEQVAGAHDRVDVRSDVYSLGAVLYELLTGRLPFDLCGRLSEAMERIATQDPPPPSGVLPRRVEIGDELDTIVLKALAKDPDRRYQSVAAFREDLEHLLKGEPIEAKRESRGYLLRKFLRRHRAAVAVSGSILVLTAAFAVGMTIMYGRASAQAQKTSRINLFLEDTLGSVEPAPGHGEVTVADFLDEGRLWVELVLRDDRETGAAVRAILANGYRNIGQLDRAEELASQSLRLLREEFGETALETTAALNMMGLIRQLQGRPEESLALLMEAERIRRRELGDNDPSVAISKGNIASVLVGMGRLDEALRWQREALAIRSRILPEGHQDIAMSRFALATTLERLDRFDEALQHHRQALEARRSRLDAAHPDLSRSLLATGLLLLRRGNPIEAEALVREALDHREQSLPEGHWRIAQARSALGSCLVALRRRAEAEPLLRAAVEVLERERGKDSPDAELARRRLAECAGGAESSMPPSAPRG
ncbi:MAG: serine/threonine protein kinase [Phycisphaerae bacterium]|nr:serine/threonine protein kinase [Phycisphaerae bacterium]